MSLSTVPSIQQRLAIARAQLSEMDDARKEAAVKQAFQPAPAMPQGGAPPQQMMDPAMQQGGPPPMDPAMQGGPPPMDPAMQGGPPPMDPAMQPPGGVPPEQLEEMMSLLEQMGQGLQEAMQRLDAQEQQMQQLTAQIEECTSTLQSAMQPAPEAHAGATEGW